MRWVTRNTIEKGCTRRFLNSLIVVGFVVSLSMEVPRAAQSSEGRCSADHFLSDRPSYRGNPPTTVYRADTRDPSTIFAAGFKGKGGGMDLVKHVRAAYEADDFDGEERSAFVATTENAKVVISFANHHLELFGTTSWIYVIRADPGFFNVEQSLHDFACRVGPYPQYFDSAIATSSVENEWVAIAAIDSANVQKACPVLSRGC